MVELELEPEVSVAGQVGLMQILRFVSRVRETVSRVVASWKKKCREMSMLDSRDPKIFALLGKLNDFFSDLSINNQ